MRFFFVLLGMAAILVAGAFIAARMYFVEPGVEVAHDLPGPLAGERVLFVFAHPDDEILVTQYFTEAQKAGVLTGLVTLTKGEAGVQVTEIGRPEDTGAIRKAELLKHGWALGVDHQRVLDFPDGGLPNVDLEELVAAASAHIESFEPDVIVTFDPNSGVTNHRDHRRAGEAATIAAERAAAGAGGPRRLVYVVAPRKALRVLGGPSGAEVADAQPEPTIGLAADWGLKLRAWNIHLSQRGWVRGQTGVPAWLMYLLWDKEYYAVRDLKADAAGG